MSDGMWNYVRIVCQGGDHWKKDHVMLIQVIFWLATGKRAFGIFNQSECLALQWTVLKACQKTCRKKMPERVSDRMPGRMSEKMSDEIKQNQIECQLVGITPRKYI